MSTAIEKIQEQLEAVRREGIAEGRAMEREAFKMAFEKFFHDYINPPAEQPRLKKPKKARTPKASSVRRPRGSNQQDVRTILEAAGKPMTATEIQKALEPDTIAYVSIRHALDQLTLLGITIKDGTTWAIKAAQPREAATETPRLALVDRIKAGEF